MTQSQEPGKYDMVMGGKSQTPSDAAVIGGMTGVRVRFSSTKIEDKIVSLTEALKYGEEGLDFLLESLRDREVQIHNIAYQLLIGRQEKELKAKLDNWLPRFEFKTVKVNSSGKIIQQETREARYFREKLGSRVDLEMVYIPGGTFLMGAPVAEARSQDSERPQHQVTVKPFFMGKYTITQAQWLEIARLPQEEKELNPCPSYFEGDTLPVDSVNWYDAVECCARLSRYTGRNYRLPSEAEWEYACRAGTTTRFHYGETITGELANCCYPYAEETGKYRGKTTPVGSLGVNAFGLYDLHGNVLEWCADDSHHNYEGAPNDGRVWDKGCLTTIITLLDISNRKVARGGSWSDHPRLCRSASRHKIYHYSNYNSVGFRVMFSFSVDFLTTEKSQS